jgi:hypothetical protein
LANLICRDDANPFAGDLIYQLVRANSVIERFYAQFSFWLPMQREVEVAGKDFPARAIGQFHYMTFMVRSDFHSFAALFLRRAASKAGAGG